MGSDLNYSAERYVDKERKKSTQNGETTNNAMHIPLLHSASASLSVLGSQANEEVASSAVTV